MKLKAAKCSFIICFYLIMKNPCVYGSGKDIIDLAIQHNAKGEYYNAITEAMRHQHLYSNGEYQPLSLLIMAEAYYKGGNYYKTINTYSSCYEKFKNSPEGETALYNLGLVRLIYGSPYFAYRSFQEYFYIYDKGKYKEDASRDICYALTLVDDFNNAEKAISSYSEQYQTGKYLSELRELKLLINDETNRPQKSLWVSALGSILMPGFGHFYTCRYSIGFFTLFTNAGLIYLFYDAYKDDSKLRMILFGLTELTFYQYSLITAITDVYEYNSKENFNKTVRLKATRNF